jgi:hypothetical protein
VTRHIQEYQLLSAKEKDVDRLAQYLGIDTTGLTKEDIAHIVAAMIMFQQTLKN